MAVRLFVENRIGTQGVDVRRGDPFVAVGRQVIRAKRIDRDQDHRRRGRRRAYRPPARGEDPGGQQADRAKKDTTPEQGREHAEPGSMATSSATLRAWRGSLSPSVRRATAR